MTDSRHSVSDEDIYGNPPGSRKTFRKTPLNYSSQSSSQPPHAVHRPQSPPSPEQSYQSFSGAGSTLLESSDKVKSPFTPTYQHVKLARTVIDKLLKRQSTRSPPIEKSFSSSSNPYAIIVPFPSCADR